jgi:hypothetical protein
MHAYVKHKLINAKLLECHNTKLFVRPLFDADGFLPACMDPKIMQSGTSAPGRVIFVDEVKGERSEDSSC